MIFNQLLSIFIQNKFWVSWHSYVHKCKQGERHTFIYTSVRIDITQHSWAGRDFWTTFLTETEERKLPNETLNLYTEKTDWRPSSLQAGGWCLLIIPMRIADLFDFEFKKTKDEDLSISPKASLPPWQVGVCFKSQSPFLFLRNTMYKNKRTIKSNKQNKINTWSPLRTFGYYKDLCFPYKILNHVAITRQTN